MPTSFQAAAVLVIALLPGALYVWTFERQAGRYGIGLSDRVLRFVGGSALLLAAFSTPLYRLHSEYWDAFVDGEPLPGGLAIIPIAYVLLPSFAGTLVGAGLRKRWGWAQVLTGPDPAPRAWDYLFQYRVDGWIRCRLKSGTWVGGAYANADGRRSYAAGYPEPQDLFLAASIEVNAETGEFVLDAAGGPQLGTGAFC